jgi:calcineurin-like phosphoesterase family protein
MDETLIDNWNSFFGGKDSVYHLGDFSFRNVKNTRFKYRDRLNGRIIMIQGNHDLG